MMNAADRFLQGAMQDAHVHSIVLKRCQSVAHDFVCLFVCLSILVCIDGVRNWFRNDQESGGNACLAMTSY